MPLLDEKGKQIISKYGKPVFRKSYSVLQDRLFEHMKEAGFGDFERGELGSTAENLSSLEYQIKQGKGRLSAIEEKVNEAKTELQTVSKKVKETRKVSAMYSEIEAMGTKTITGKYTVSKEELDNLKSMAKEGLFSRGRIGDLENQTNNLWRELMAARSRLNSITERFQELKEQYTQLEKLTRPYLEALKHFPDKVKAFFETLFPPKAHGKEQEHAEPPKRTKRRSDWER